MSIDLTSPQLRALLDILVHVETYSEVESFKDPEAIDHYGYPFCGNSEDQKATKDGQSSSPLLQLLLTRIVLPIPGLRDLPGEFWNAKFRGIMRRFGEADLSESYDKGTLGSRKRLASAASVIHELITRGILSGVSNDELPDLQRRYDSQNAGDLTEAWDHSVHQLVHGNLINELFDQATRSPDIEGHSPAIKAAVDYAIIYIATFLHHLFVLSAEGPYLLKLLDNVHKLVPYSVIGQTLRVGNAGMMISGMVRLFLAKVSVGAISNWMGFTQNAADGMNLMQRIISMVLEWDTSEFRKAIETIKQSSDRPSDAQLAAINQHLDSTRDRHDSVRQQSIQERKSVIATILESKRQDLTKSLTESQHIQCMEYYSAQLAIRDRQKIIDVLCRQSPDLTTSIVRDGVSAFEPMIRAIHKQVDIRKHLGAVESFLSDLIATSQPKKADEQKNASPPSVEDYVGLLRRNRQLLFDFLHDVAKGCPDLRDTWCAWANDAIKVFQEDAPNKGKTPTSPPDGGKSTTGAGAMGPGLQEIFAKLPIEAQRSVRDAVDAHQQYLDKLEMASKSRMQQIVDGMGSEMKTNHGSMSGPGIYLSRWQSLLDSTVITPGTPSGPPRQGKDVKSLKALGKTEAMASSETWDANAIIEQDEKALPQPPDVSTVVAALRPHFRDMVAEISRKGAPQG